MKKIRCAMTILVVITLAVPFMFVESASASGPVTQTYDDLTLSGTGQKTHWNEVWNLTKGDLTLSYTIDMTAVTQPSAWNSSFTEVGIRHVGAGDFNPGPWNTYQGGAGGWMASSIGDLAPNPDGKNLHDKHNLSASGGRGDADYDATAPGTIVAPFGSGNNYGIWFDRDGVDQWQATEWGMIDHGTYNTGGVYKIVLKYHAVSPTLGTIFATINGVPTGFYTAGWKNAQPEMYPAGLSFKGDMTKMQVFAGLWAPGAGYGSVTLSDITVAGYLKDMTPPAITYNLTGTLGTNGWYTSDVFVDWTVSDPDSSATTDGCDDVTINTDTAGTTLTCTATSEGGTSSASVTIKRDATPPSLAPVVTLNPVALNGSATAEPNASDDTSGVASSSCDPVNTSAAGARSVTCYATDNAGNSSSQSAEYVVVPLFPTSAVLDDFNRSNGKAGSNWAPSNSLAAYRIAGQRLDVQLGGALIWKPTSFGASQEAFVTLSAIDPRSPTQGLLLKAQSSSRTEAGVIVVVYDALAKGVRVSALRLNGRSWTIYGNIPAVFADGDQLGGRALANGNVEIYRNGTLIATITLSAQDQAFFNTRGGRIGIWSLAAPRAFLDDFGGGNTAP